VEAKAELLTIAQLAVTLIGFSSLVTVFRMRMISDWAPRDVTAAAIVICAGGMGLFYSLFPFVLAYAGMTDGTTWAITSVVFSFGLLAGATIFLVVDRRLSQTGHPARMPLLNQITIFLAAAFGLALIANAFLVTVPRRPAVYLAALIFLLIIPVCFMAFRLWLFAPTRDDA
jgi:hypothetical protein